MPFRNPALIIARILRLLGNAGQKIEAHVDSSGTPRIDFYTGLSGELSPGSIFVDGIDSLNQVGSMVIQTPIMDSLIGPASLELFADQNGTLFARLKTSRLELSTPDQEFLIDCFAADLHLRTAGGNMLYEVQGGNHKFVDGAILLEDGLQFMQGGVNTGGRLQNMNAGSVQSQPANSSGGRVVAHGLGFKPTVYGAFTQEGNSTFRAVNDDANTDANDLHFIFRNTQNNAVIGTGTNVSFRWFAMLFP